MPVEFSAAAYRLGHSMVRQRYAPQQGVPRAAGFPAVLRLQRPLGRHHRRSCAEPADGADAGSGPAEQLDHRLAALLRTRRQRRRGGYHDAIAQARSVSGLSRCTTLPGGGGNLAFRNLKRGVNLGLPSGQDVAKHMKVKNPLTPGRDRLRQQRLDRRRRGQAAGPAYRDAALVLHPQGGQGPARRRAARPGRLDHHLGSVRRPRPRRPEFLPVAGEELEADAAVGRRRATSPWWTCCAS